MAMETRIFSVYGEVAFLKLGNGDGTFRDGQSNITGLIPAVSGST